MRTDVIFSILMLLCNHRQVTREEIATRYELSKRTVTRYIGVLMDSGLPIESRSGKGGGICIAPDFAVNNCFFTTAELKRIVDSLNLTEMHFNDLLNRKLLDKLGALDKFRPEENYSIKQENLIIQDESYSGTVAKQLSALSHAIDGHRQTDIKYTDSFGRVTYRQIDPYCLIFKMQDWYVYAYCRLRHDFRLFKIKRMRDLRVTSKTFTVSTEADALKKIEQEFSEEAYVKVDFEFFPALRSEIEQWLGEKSIIERHTKLYASAYLPHNAYTIKKLLSFGSSVTVISPTDIKNEIDDEVFRMAAKRKLI